MSLWAETLSFSYCRLEERLQEGKAEISFLDPAASTNANETQMLRPRRSVNKPINTDEITAINVQLFQALYAFGLVSENNNIESTTGTILTACLCFKLVPLLQPSLPSWSGPVGSEGNSGLQRFTANHLEKLQVRKQTWLTKGFVSCSALAGSGFVATHTYHSS